MPAGGPSGRSPARRTGSRVLPPAWAQERADTTPRGAPDREPGATPRAHPHGFPSRSVRGRPPGTGARTPGRGRGPGRAAGPASRGAGRTGNQGLVPTATATPTAVPHRRRGDAGRADRRRTRTQTRPCPRTGPFGPGGGTCGPCTACPPGPEGGGGTSRPVLERETMPGSATVGPEGTSACLRDDAVVRGPGGPARSATGPGPSRAGTSPFRPGSGRASHGRVERGTGGRGAARGGGPAA